MNIVNIMARKGNSFTFNEFIKASKVSANVAWVLLHRLEKRGAIERIEKGKYLIIPLGAEKGKYTLHEFVIGSLLVKPACIAYWSALHHYHISEQIPNTVFIQTTARKKRQELEIFGIKYKFVRVKETKFFGARKEWLEETPVEITDREKTIIDCLDKPQYCGGLIEILKGFKSFKEIFNNDKLIKYALKIGNTGVLRRLGYITDYYKIKINIPHVNTRNYLLLDPTLPPKGKNNAKWRVIVNIDEKDIGNLE